MERAKAGPDTAAVPSAATGRPPSGRNREELTNGNGQIVANGSHATGQSHAFLLTPH